MKNNIQLIDNKISQLSKEIENLKSDKQRITQQYPPRIAKAKELLKYGYSENWIQSQLYASRGDNIGIDHIVEIIELAKTP